MPHRSKPVPPPRVVSEPPVRPSAHPPGRLLAGLADPALVAALRAILKASGIDVEPMGHARLLGQTLQRGPFDCIVLDDALPGLDTVSGLQQLRAVDPVATVIALCRPGPVERRVHLLDQGADDVLDVPVQVQELAARVRAASRRQRRSRDAAVILEHGPLRLQFDRRVAQWDGRDVVLTSMEFWLLETLARHRDLVLSRPLLEELLYGWNGDTSSNTVEVYVHHLRRKLHPRIVRTVRGHGYQLGRADQLGPEPGPRSQDAERGPSACGRPAAAPEDAPPP